MSTLLRRLDELRLAVMLLSRLPVGRLSGTVSLADARWAYPLVGVPLGGMAGVCFWAGLGLGATPALAAILALGVLALLTGGLHHDGLADFADGIAGATRARRLEIMRDSRIGTYGVLALVFVLAAAATALADLAEHATVAAFMMVAVVSRFAMLVVLSVLPAARADGLGHAAEGAGAAGLGHLMPGGFASLGLILWIGPLGVACAGVCAAVAAGIALLAYRRLGGQTGDVLGAVQIAGDTAQWVILAIMTTAMMTAS
ncbi:MAG: adenosylcobinamide-GDP ribazoletransferase [Pseudomonadota bacterium]